MTHSTGTLTMPHRVTDGAALLAASLHYAATALSQSLNVANVLAPQSAPRVQSPMSWIASQTKRVKELSPDWDGYGADSIDPAIVDRIRTLLQANLSPLSKPGSIVPGADGSVQAEWHLKDLSVGLLVEDDGTVSSWAHRPGTDIEIERFGFEAIQMFTSLAKVALA